MVSSQLVCETKKPVAELMLQILSQSLVNTPTSLAVAAAAERQSDSEQKEDEEVGVFTGKLQLKQAQTDIQNTEHRDSSTH